MAQRGGIQDFFERTNLPLLIIVLIPVFVVLYVIFGSNANTGSSDTTPAAGAVQNTTPAPPPPASISLNDPGSLPQQVATAQLVPFSFTVQKTSDQSATYQYKVSVHWSTGENDVIDENTFSLAAGASTVIQEQLKFEIATETADVIFELPQTGQTSQFTLPRAQ